jgi:hypothetical protein
MADALPASGVVHWVGAGRSTGTGLSVLCADGARVRLWHRTTDRANQSLTELGLAGRAAARALEPGALDAELEPGDVVVSMLPASEHPDLLRSCLRNNAHFACTSYVSDELLELAPDASAQGVVVLAEAGLDPGIDHVFAHDLVARAKDVIGTGPAEVHFTSYCGGVPAEPNEFRYRFSWAPRGVLNALRSPARYVTESATVTCARPWEATTTIALAGERFEAYPNRDSMPFVAQYDFPSTWSLGTFVRGTLRLDGWCAAWAPVFETLRAGDDARIAALADELAERYPTTATDHDRVVLAVELRARHASGQEWSGRYHLDVVGDDHESAMASCVSQPLAFGIAEILRDAMPAGLTRAAESAGDARRWLAHLASQGLMSTLEVEPA